MKFIAALFILCLSRPAAAQVSDRELVTKACLNYVEGFYEGDSSKLASSLKPTLNKFGFWKEKGSDKYLPDGYMTYQQAIDYAKRVFAKKKFAKPDDIKKVDVLDVQNCIASAKVTAKWGVDYLLLSKQDGRWMIEQVLWEGPLQN